MEFAFSSQPSQLTPTNSPDSIPVSIPQGSLPRITRLDIGITRLDRGTLLHSHHMMPVSSQTQFFVTWLLLLLSFHTVSYKILQG